MAALQPAYIAFLDWEFHTHSVPQFRLLAVGQQHDLEHDFSAKAKLPETICSDKTTGSSRLLCSCGL